MRVTTTTDQLVARLLAPFAAAMAEVARLSRRESLDVAGGGAGGGAGGTSPGSAAVPLSVSPQATSVTPPPAAGGVRVLAAVSPRRRGRDGVPVPGTGPLGTPAAVVRPEVEPSGVHILPPSPLRHRGAASSPLLTPASAPTSTPTSGPAPALASIVPTRQTAPSPAPHLPRPPFLPAQSEAAHANASPPGWPSAAPPPLAAHMPYDSTVRRSVTGPPAPASPAPPAASSNPAIGSAPLDPDALRDAMVRILRDAARLQGLEV